MNTGVDYDVVIIGGGPAGATVATLLADAGIKTLVLERGRFPRFHIGESLMPETYWVFERLGMLPKLKASPFVRKHSVQFVTSTGKESQPFYFEDVNPHECSVTWQVVRSEFDQMMLDNAAEHGAEIWQDANVIDVLLEPNPDDALPRATAVVVTRPTPSPSQGEGRGGGETTLNANRLPSANATPTQPPPERGRGRAPITIRAKVVVDATGMNALLSRKLNLKKPDPNLRKASYFAHYKGGRRDSGRDEGATLVLSTREQDGWFWYIPLPDDIVSVGVVGDIDRLVTRNKGKSPEQILEEEITHCPGLDGRLDNATRVSPVHVLSDFSYRASRCAGHGWVLVGDAFGFLDPMYSSGVFLALKSGEMAADAIIEAFEKQDFSPAQLGKWGPELAAGMQSIRKLVYAFYTKDFSFGRFIRENPDFKKNLVDLLIGNVFYDGVNDIFTPMAKGVMLPEAIPLEQPAEDRRELSGFRVQGSDRDPVLNPEP